MNVLEYLTSRGIDLELKGHNSYKLEASPFMPLTVETWFVVRGSILNISICHYGEMNGDLMKDPDVLMQYDKTKDQITFLEFQNDYAGVYQNRDSNPNLQAELQEFMNMWIQNLIDQGHTLQKRFVEEENQ